MPTELRTTSPLPFTLGDIASFGGLSLVPLFASEPPGLHFIGLDEAMAGGLAVSEVDEAGMVSDLSVSNLLGLDVLLFEGEEFVGAKQNRILDRTILVAAISKTQVPVSCVESQWLVGSELLVDGGLVALSGARARRALVRPDGGWPGVRASTIMRV